MTKLLQRFWKENKILLMFVALMFVFRSACADWNDVPTSSMEPTILAGDRILINKMAYDIRFPFTHISLLKLKDPARGDIVVFESKIASKRLVKRVVGVPGDLVELRDNVLYVNRQALEYTALNSQHAAELGIGVVEKQEDLLGIKHGVRLSELALTRRDFSEMHIPEGKFLALGDNRDNSADSRVIGLVPREEIIGRARHVILSLDYDNYFLPRRDRFLNRL